MGSVGGWVFVLDVTRGSVGNFIFIPGNSWDMLDKVGGIQVDTGY